RIRYLVIGLSGLFGFQLVFTAADILFVDTHVGLVALQPIVLAVSAPFILMALRRTAGAPMDLHISRELVFRTGVLVVSGALLMTLSVLAYLVEAFGGAWDFAVLTLLILIGAMVMAVIIGSNRVRIRGRRFLARHVYRRKYDYQHEWERVSEQLTESSLDYDLGQRVIRALARVTESEAGALWTLSESESLLLTSSLRVGWRNPIGREATLGLKAWFRDHPDTIDLRRPPKGLQALLRNLPAEHPDLRFVVPLQTDTRLVGIVGLQTPIIRIDLDWEDHELLKLIANESTGFVALQDAERTLSESGKLASYHQIAAFIVHDAKTISAQLTLLLRNAQKHKTNPAFIDDMLSTVDNAVQRLGNMLEHMNSREAEHESTVDLGQLVADTLRPYEHQHPAPRLAVASDCTTIRAAPAELRSAIGHIVQNAIDAAAENASDSHPPSVDIAVVAGDRWHEVIVSDNGSGMDPDFIRERLFAPFVSTKGVSGMGIGAYQARTYIRALGGDITVASKRGEGTRFCIRMPAAAAEVT
ncbi:MAG: XrtA/PEP-CTERM system histidine kinase PrsK, partial [Pseudomonadales bacterium]